MLANSTALACLHIARVTSAFQSLSGSAHIPLPQDRADAWFTAQFLCYMDIGAAKQYPG